MFLEKLFGDFYLQVFEMWQLFSMRQNNLPTPQSPLDMDFLS